MNETVVTVVGNVATEPEFQQTATGVGVTRFRLATTARRWDAERGAWTDGATSFYTVRAWRTLAGHVKESVGLGEPLVVQGRLRICEEDHDGRRFVTADLDAVALGHDLSRGVARFSRTSAALPAATAAAATGVAAPGRAEAATPEPAVPAAPF
ncbi:single-strand DNA-binding protein [Actinacidiphila alni]|uniref:Single-strand DNA-binding protein n=1 Tax=Actinacidiphila alni TaxID=380248 RepID=A0A1I2J372_9ACTN|nr:single-stranded DNA-binding protein [Actinacidiphila alni]SFF49115.1 single-strand DNA-binding protein [Actinacidiphila alni]